MSGMWPSEHKLPATTTPEDHGRSTTTAVTTQASPTGMAATVQFNNRSTSFSHSARPTLPPLSREGMNHNVSLTSGTLPQVLPTAGVHSPSSSTASSLSVHSYEGLDTRSRQHRYSSGWSPRRPDIFSHDSHNWSPRSGSAVYDSATSSLKRSYGAMSHHSDRMRRDATAPASVGSLDSNSSPYSGNNYTYAQVAPHQSRPGFSSPNAAHDQARSLLPPLSIPQTVDTSLRRCTLHIRQQPRAARAGPDGKDRRAIDPPPVLQLMIDGFDPNSQEDMNEIKSSHFVVHCRLISPDSPRRDLSSVSSTNIDGSVEVQRLLLGTAVSSPFFCADDPDPETMPHHPRTTQATSSGPPSPSSRFIQPHKSANDANAVQHRNLPGCFFIFADLSIRKAGEYRLEFCLMKIDSSTMTTGSKLPIIHTVTSQIFKGVNAKDFDQVQPSTDLVKGLLDRGAGFPLKLKKGIREGQVRKVTDDENEYNENENEDEDDD